MQMMKIEDLKPHERNSEFFDDMTGEKWQEFLDSIKTSGVIEPIVVTQDKVIVSGHQRVRACKELGIKEILAEVRVYEDEDKIIKDLLETNIRQRGDIGGSSIKLGRRIKELERIYGIREGSAGGNGGANQFAPSANGTSSKMTEKELAEKLGIGLDTLKRAKSLTNLSPEIQQLIEQGTISPSTAARLVAKLSPKEQEALIANLPATQKFTQSQVQSYIDKLKQAKNQIDGYKMKADREDELKREVNRLQGKISELNDRKPEVITKEVKPKDYDSVKADNVELKADNARMAREYKEKCQELFAIRDRLKAIEEDNTKNKIENELERDCIFFCARCDDFIKNVGGYAYLSDKLDMLPEAERNGYYKAVQMIASWAENILNNN